MELPHLSLLWPKIRSFSLYLYRQAETVSPEVTAKVLMALLLLIPWIIGVVSIAFFFLFMDALRSIFSSWRAAKGAGYVLLITIFIPRIFPSVNWDYFYSKMTGSYTTFVDPDPTACLNEYKHERYATAPKHEEKLRGHLEKMGFMDSPKKIQEYIDTFAPGSPVTGEMVWKTSHKYSVDARLMIALMHQDSHFGTEGKARRSRNPGNVGNDDSGKMVYYKTWQEGVDAVAKWLSRNRKIVSSYIPKRKQKTIPHGMVFFLL